MVSPSFEMASRPKICQKDMVFSLIPCMLWCQKLKG
jgi:hypothetical protein